MFDMYFESSFTWCQNPFYSFDLIVEPHLTATVLTQSPSYSAHIILAQRKAWSVIFIICNMATFLWLIDDRINGVPLSVNYLLFITKSKHSSNLWNNYKDIINVLLFLLLHIIHNLQRTPENSINWKGMEVNYYIHH